MAKKEITRQVETAMLLSLQDVAGRLQLSVRTVRGFIDSRELRAVRIGNSIRVLESALSEFISKQTIKS